MISIVIGSILFYFFICCALTVSKASKQSLKRLSNDELVMQKQQLLKQYAIAKENKAYGEMGHVGGKFNVINKELASRGALPALPTHVLSLVDPTVNKGLDSYEPQPQIPLAV